MPLTDPSAITSDTDRTSDQLQKQFDFSLAAVLAAIDRLGLSRREQQVLEAVARLSWTSEGQLQPITVSCQVIADSMSASRNTARAALERVAEAGYITKSGKADKVWRGVCCSIDRHRLFSDAPPGHHSDDQNGDQSGNFGDQPPGDGDQNGDQPGLVTNRELESIQSRTPPISRDVLRRLEEQIELLTQQNQQILEEVQELRECIGRRKSATHSGDQSEIGDQLLVTKTGDQETGAHKSAAPFSLEKEKNSNQPTNQTLFQRGAASQQGDGVSFKPEAPARQSTWNVDTIKNTLLQQLNLQTGVGVDYAGTLFVSARRQGLVSIEDRDEFLALCVWIARQKWMTSPGGYLRLQIERGKWRKKFTPQDLETVQEFFQRVATHKSVHQPQEQLSRQE